MTLFFQFFVYFFKIKKIADFFIIRKKKKNTSLLD